MSILACISWIAVFAGFAGTWAAGRHHWGWLFGVFSSALWFMYDVERAIWSGAFAALIAIGLSFRNYMIGKNKRV